MFIKEKPYMRLLIFSYFLGIEYGNICGFNNFTNLKELFLKIVSNFSSATT